MQVKPLSDHILIRRDVAEEKSSGGIIIPSMAQEKSQRGTVIAVGDGGFDERGRAIEMEMVAGDTVLISSNTHTTPIEVDGEELDFIRLKDVRAVIPQQ